MHQILQGTWVVTPLVCGAPSHFLLLAGWQKRIGEVRLFLDVVNSTVSLTSRSFWYFSKFRNADLFPCTSRFSRRPLNSVITRSLLLINYPPAKTQYGVSVMVGYHCRCTYFWPHFRWLVIGDNYHWGWILAFINVPFWCVSKRVKYLHF